jgi:hypothetical protein
MKASAEDEKGECKTGLNESDGLDHKVSEAKAGGTQGQREHKVGQGSGDTRQNKALLWRAVDFLSKEMLISLDAYFLEYVPLFNGAHGKHIDHKLEWTTAFAEYERLFDTHLEGFAEREGFEKAEDFYQFVVDTQSESKSVAKMAKLFVARADYQNFVSMMNRRALIAGAKDEY